MFDDGDCRSAKKGATRERKGESAGVGQDLHSSQLKEGFHIANITDYEER